jgi:hypothetical protein
LTLPNHLFKIVRPERFSPHAAALRSPAFGSGKAIYVCNEKNRYQPRLTLFRRSKQGFTFISLRIEFSAPKLIFGNNFEEFHGGESDAVIMALHTALARMGVEVGVDDLKNAGVVAIHYSKNFLLPRHTPCFLLMQALEKLDLSLKLDLTKTDYRNAGQMVKYHANTYEIALYDKIKDLERARKYGSRRGEEAEYLTAGNVLRNVRQRPEVLRFEVRLSSRKLKSLLRTLRLERPRTLESLFSPEIASAVLLYYWGQITTGLYAMMIDTGDAASLIHSLRTAFPRKRQGKIMEIVGFLTACQQIGMRGTAAALALKPHQIYRLRADVKAFQKTAPCPRFSVLDGIKSELLKFTPLTGNDLKATLTA